MLLKHIKIRIRQVEKEIGTVDCTSCESKKRMVNSSNGKKIPGKAQGKCTRPEGFCDVVTDRAKDIEVMGKGEAFDIALHLTSEEKSQLEQCETVIRKNIKAFFEAGQALAEIRDNRLYRENYKTFEHYCKQEWDFGRSYADRQIGSYEAIKNLKMTPIGVKNMNNQDAEIIDLDKIDSSHQTVILPQNEAQARPLTKLKPEDQIEAWSIVLDQLNEGKKLTSFLIGQAVKQVKGETLKKTVQEERQAVEKTTLVSNTFKRQYQSLLDVVYDEKSDDWRASSQKEVVRWLKALIKIAEGDE